MASLAAAAAAILGAISQFVRPSGDYAWYKRWVEMRGDKHSEAETQLIERRISLYVVELAVSDCIRKRRVFPTIFGLVALLFGIALTVMANLNPAQDFGVQVLVTVLVFLFYAGAVFALWLLPGRMRIKKRAEIYESLGKDLSTLTDEEWGVH